MRSAAPRLESRLEPPLAPRPAPRQAGPLAEGPDPAEARAEELAEALARLRLIRSRRVGPATYHRLIAEHGSARAALGALPDLARAAGVSGYAPCPPEAAEAELAAARLLGARALFHGMPGYPADLARLPDAPALLWALGDPGLLARPLVALIGARNASSLGQRMARRLAQELGEAGFAVVSGLARGIDRAAHEGALESGTIAVQAGGVDVMYPVENTDLAHEIARAGLRLSEQPPGLAPQARHFPQRNRIIAGLVRAVVVVEAAPRSGSLITARAALDAGREVMAVPGHPIDARAAGCNMLIRDGAVLVRSAADVIEALGGPAEPALPFDPAPVPMQGARAAAAAAAAAPVGPRAPTTLPAAARHFGDVASLHGAILAQLGPTPMAEDQLLRDLGQPAARVAPELLALELAGKLRRHAGGLLSRAV